MKGLRDSAGFRDSKENNECVLNKIWSKEGKVIDTVKARKLAHYGHTMRKQGSCLQKEIMQGTRCTRARKTTHGLGGQHQVVDNSVEESIRMTEDRDK